MRLLVVSHACVVNLNQTLYADLESRPEMEVGLVAPRRWKGDYGMLRFERLPQFKGPVFLAPGGGDAAIHLHSHPSPGRVLAEFQPDLLLIDEEPASVNAWKWTGAAHRKGIRSLLYCNENLSRQLAFPQDAMERDVLSRIWGAATLTERAGEMLRKSGFQGRLRTIPHGIDADRADGGGVEALGNLPSPLVGYMGRLWEGKGIFDLLDALLLLQRRGWAGSALFVGDGPDRERLQAAVLASPLKHRVVVAPALAHRQVPAWVGACAFTVVPSRTTDSWMEQLSRSALESMAWGVPVIVSDSGSNPGSLEAVGGGLIFEEGNAAELADRIELLSCDRELCQRLAARGQAGVKRLHGRARVAGQWLSFLNEAVTN